MAIDWFPLWLSLRVAVISTALALVIGLWIAYLLANREFRGKEVLDAAVTLPLVLPPTVLGYYLLVVLGRHGAAAGASNEWIFGRPAGLHLAGRGGGGAGALAAAAGQDVASGARKRGPHATSARRARSARPSGSSSGASPCRSPGAPSSPPRCWRSRARWATSASPSWSRGNIPGRTQTVRGRHLRRRRERQRATGAHPGAGDLRGGAGTHPVAGQPPGLDIPSRAGRRRDDRRPHRQAFRRAARIGAASHSTSNSAPRPASPCCSARSGSGKTLTLDAIAGFVGAGRRAYPARRPDPVRRAPACI